jgi:hypothetical protein
VAEVPTAKFADTARRLAVAARAAGLVAPVFRSPPRGGSALRTIRRLPGGPVVAVRVRARPFAEVTADMIEGVVVANQLDAATAIRVRALLAGALPASGSRPEAA